MSFSLLGSATAGGSNSATTTAINTTGAAILVVSVSFYNHTSATLTDSAGNIWAALPLQTSGQDCNQLFYCLNPITGSSHTFSVTMSGGFPAIAALAFSGRATAMASTGSTTTSGTTIQAGSITPTVNGSLIIATTIQTQVATLSVDSGMTLIDKLLVTGTNMGVGCAYLIQGTAAAINPTWTESVSQYSCATLACFSPVASSGSGFSAGIKTGGAL